MGIPVFDLLACGLELFAARETGVDCPLSLGAAADEELQLAVVVIEVPRPLVRAVDGRDIAEYRHILELQFGEELEQLGADGTNVPDGTRLCNFSAIELVEYGAAREESPVLVDTCSGHNPAAGLGDAPLLLQPAQGIAEPLDDRVAVGQVERAICKLQIQRVH